MAKVIFKRKTSAEIEELGIEDGSLIYNTDNGKTYMDFEDQRIQTGGNADTMISASEEEPDDEDIKVWIKPNKIIKSSASNVVDNMNGNENNLSPSVRATKEYVNNLQTYSEEEIMVGTFEDGKPIYQKTVIGTYADGQEVISNIDSIVSVEGTAALGGVVRIIPYFELYNNQVYLATMSKKNDNKIYANASYVGQSSEATFKVTLKYTKTTD